MYLFPDDNIPQSEKQSKDFGLAVMRGIDTISQKSSFMNRAANPHMTLREMYSDGNQPIDLYKNLYLGGTDNISVQTRTDVAAIGSSRSYVNINWKVYSPMVKVLSVLRSLFSKRDYRVEVRSLMRDHMNEKADKKWRLYTRSVSTNELRKEIGLSVPKDTYLPQDKGGLELADKMGLFKLELEGTLEKIIEHSFDVSDWRKLRRKFQRNTIDHRFMVARVTTHPTTGAAMFRWVDPKKVVMQWNPDNLGETPMFIGHYEAVQIKDLKEILLNEGYDAEEIESNLKSALTASRKNNEVDFKAMDGNHPAWYSYTIDVLKAEYVSTNMDTKWVGKNKEGESKIVDAKKDSSGKLKENKFEGGETIFVEKNFLYTGSMVVGTDFVYEWGESPFQLRDKKNDVMYTYVWEYLDGRSMTERAMTILDDLQMCVYKLRVAVAAAAPKGYDIDLGEIANISVGGKVLDMFELMKIKRETGVNIRKTAKIMGQKEKLSAIEENDGGIGAQMNEWLTMIQTNITLLFDELGIPNVMAAQGLESAEKAVGVVKEEIGGAINSTFDEVESELLFKKRLSEVVLAQARLSIRVDDNAKDYYKGLFGDNAIKCIESIEDLTLEQIGISLVPKPTEMEKAQLMADCIELTKATRDGFMPFTQADVVVVRNLLNNDQLELATIYLSKTVNENKAKHAEEQRAMAEHTANMQNQVAEQTAQREAGIQQMKMQGELALLEKKIELETAMKSRLQAEKGVIEMQQIQTEIAAEKALGTNIRNERA